jgi:transcriptional regulator with XRE-family HTH domain
MKKTKRSRGRPLADPRTQLGQAIRQARMAQKKTPLECSRAVGVSRGTWSRWELGIREPRLDMLATVARLLGLSLDQITRRKANQSHSGCLTR